MPLLSGVALRVTRLLRFPGVKPLAEYDPALAQRLLRSLRDVLRDELGQSPREADALAGQVSWSVSRESDGLWLRMGHLGVGGTWRSHEAGLRLYVRQLAYDLVGRASEFQP